MSKQFPLSLIIRAIDKATGPLKRINDKLEQMTKPLRVFGREWSKLMDFSGMNRLSGALTNVGSQFGRVSREMQSGLFKLGATLGVVAYLFNTQLVDTAATFESLNVMLYGTEKSAAGVAKAFGFIQQFAFDTPITLRQTTDAFVRLRQWGLDPTNGTMQAIVDTAAAMGPDGMMDRLNGMILALGQSMGAMRLQGQDVNQMIQRGIPVWKILQSEIQRTTGKVVTVGQLMKAMEERKLGVKYINMLIEGMGRANAGASERLAKTWGGLVSRVEDFWDIFRNMIMQAGVFDFIKGKLEEILATLSKWMKDGTLQKWAKVVGDNLVSGLKALWEILPEVWDGLVRLGGIIRWIADAVGGWSNFVIVVAALMAGPLLMAIIGFGVAVGGLISAFFLLSLPVQVVIAAILGLIAVGLALYENWDAIVAGLVSLWEGFATVVGETFDGIYNYVANFDLGAALGDMLKAAFSYAEAFIPQWFKDLVGGAFELGTSVGSYVQEAFGGTEQAAASAGGVMPNGRVDVRFQNVPRGVRVQPQGKFTGVNLSAGYSLQDAN